MTFKNRITPLRTDRFGDRVKFAGNLDKNDLSITISDVQLSDEGIYKCSVRNPPDRVEGHGTIQLSVVTECKCKSHHCESRTRKQFQNSLLVNGALDFNLKANVF